MTRPLPQWNWKDIFLQAVTFPDGWNLDWFLLPKCNSQGFYTTPSKLFWLQPCLYHLISSTVMRVVDFCCNNFASMQKSLSYGPYSESNPIFNYLILAGSISSRCLCLQLFDQELWEIGRLLYRKIYSTLTDFLFWLEIKVLSVQSVYIYANYVEDFHTNRTYMLSFRVNTRSL